MSDYDNLNQAQAGPRTQEAGHGVQFDLLSRLHKRRRELERELMKVCNSIEFCNKNQALVEVVEVVLASRDKCDPRPLGF